MSLYSALRISVAGLDTNSRRMGMISDNIANINTTGYKRIDSAFSTFVAGDSPTIGRHLSGGVVNINRRDISRQGNIEGTRIATDLAITGDGYFPVVAELAETNNGSFEKRGNVFFTRSGEFRVDGNGNLRNSDGYYLLSWESQEAGDGFNETNELNEMVPVNVNGQIFNPQPTSAFDIGLNIVPSTPRGADNAFQITQEIIDAEGASRNLTLSFEKEPAETHSLYFNDGSTTYQKDVQLRMPGAWRVYANVEGASIQTYDSLGEADIVVNDTTNVPIADITFDSDGRLSAFGAPGAFNMFLRSNLPVASQELLNNGPALALERGSMRSAPYDISGAASAYNDVRDLLIAHDVPASAFSATPTAAEITAGIISLDTEAYPHVMDDIMIELNDASAWRRADFRRRAGLPNGSQGIDNLFLDINPDRAAITAGASVDRLGARGLGRAEDSRNYLGARIISADGIVRTHTNADTDSTVDTRLQPFSSQANDGLRLTIDYDNNSSSINDQIDLDIDFGSLALNSFMPNSFLNNSNITNSVIGEGGEGNSGLTQYDDALSTMRYADQNGYKFSSIESVNITDKGVVEGHYSNDAVLELYKIPVVIFNNPNGLDSVSGSVFKPTISSGEGFARSAGTDQTGTIQSSSREASAVDLATEFTNMITTQRIYSASAKVITTTDAMLDELTRTIR